jgi:hypothetical protein
MLMVPHCLDHQHTDGGKFVSIAHRPRSVPQNTRYLLLFEVECTMRLEVLCKFKNSVTSSGLEPATFRLVA